MVNSLKAVKKPATRAISHQLFMTERKWAAVFNLEYYVNKAKILEQMGADSIGSRICRLIARTML